MRQRCPQDGTALAEQRARVCAERAPGSVTLDGQVAKNGIKPRVLLRTPPPDPYEVTVITYQAFGDLPHRATLR